MTPWRRRLYFWLSVLFVARRYRTPLATAREESAWSGWNGYETKGVAPLRAVLTDWRNGTLG